MKEPIVGRTQLHFSVLPSTQSYLLNLLKKDKMEKRLLVSADWQTQGRGQRGNKWLGEKRQNLYLSFSLPDLQLPAHSAFLLNEAVSICLVQWLADELGLLAAIKWPNDILLNGQKVGGILINTNILAGKVKQAVIGIGINVNQRSFPQLPRQATSLALQTNTIYVIWALRNSLVAYLNKHLIYGLEDNTSTRETYLQYLYLWGRESWFEIKGKKEKMRLIGLDESGRLLLAIDEENQKAFDLKEVRFLE